uniref:Uncharacterized protein n=1 Tax=Entomoneis paludosa TaxID=265537 RepID=A0A7S2YRG0_9STRA
MFSELVPYICVGNVTLMFGSMSWTILGASGRVGLATATGFLGSWGVTLPLSALSTLFLGYDLQGMVSAIVIGYSCSGAMNSYFLMRSNWENLARKIQKKNRNYGVAKIAPTDAGIETTINYDYEQWEELPDHAKDAALLIGFDEDRWNNGENPELFESPWEALQVQEREAALFLGYKQEEWGSRQKETFEDCDWSELPDDAQEAALTLGHTESTWNNNKKCDALVEVSWHDLSMDQQEAAIALGYDEEKWNDGLSIASSISLHEEGGSKNEHRRQEHQQDTTGFSLDGDSSTHHNEDHDNNPDSFEERDWSERPDYVQEAAREHVLESDIWNSNDERDEDVMNVLWHELSQEQQETAILIGFSDNMWNMCVANGWRPS